MQIVINWWEKEGILFESYLPGMEQAQAHHVHGTDVTNISAQNLILIKSFTQ